MEIEGFFLLLVLLIIGSILVTGIVPVFMNYDYDNNIGSFFELSDKASTIDKKLEYLQQYEAALKNYGLDSGQSTIFFPTKNTNLEENFAVLGSLKQRLVDTAKMNPSSFEYQQAISQITSQEYCWFPTDVFLRGFYLKRYLFWLAWFPTETTNRCATRTTNSG